ncbi:hypothetical protein FB446DRAFT_708724 [Lentinula raphanica]|nr:hypothetical protein FB446DRAFT_708724 [Lentinula raphanica]
MRCSAVNHLELELHLTLTTSKQCARSFYDVILRSRHCLCNSHSRTLYSDIDQGNSNNECESHSRVKSSGIILGDWNFAAWVANIADGPAESRFRIGTRPYIAHEQHDSDWKGPRQYRHDLEALFYVIVLSTSLHSKPRKEVSNSVDKKYRYHEWYQLDDTTMFDLKSQLMYRAWSPPVTPFFTHVFEWLGQIQISFRHGFAKQADFLQAKQAAERPGGKWRPPELQFYKDDILDGHISYMKMVSIMHEFNELELDTRDSEAQEYLQSQKMLQSEES